MYRSTDGGDKWSDGSGDLPKVVGNSVVSDPSDPNIWYLATDTGLFRTTNSGVNWLAFDNGIPNIPCTGLVVDVPPKILYCGTWGRGAYKLDISPGVVKEPVDIYLRDNDLDTGERLPSPSGLPDPLVPAPTRANFWTSPDIKVNHDPFFDKQGVFDGVDFDTALVHQDPYRGQNNRFYVQVQNRGWHSTQNVSVRTFLADASAGLPNMPNALTAPNFDLVNTTTWTPVGPAKTISDLKPNRPVILTWDFIVPVTEAIHSCCLVVISCPDDLFTNTSTNISQLVKNDKHVCLKNLHFVDPGPGGMPLAKEAIDFHNPSSTKARLDILIRPSGFASGRIGLLLPKITFTGDEEGPGRGVDILPLCSDDPLGNWYLKGPQNTKPSKEASKRLAQRFSNVDQSRIFDFDPTTTSSLVGIEIAPQQTLKAILVTSLNNDVYLTGPARLEIYQLLDDELVGGSTFQFGYELPPLGTLPLYRRIRITADELEFDKKHGDGCDGDKEGHGNGNGNDDSNGNRDEGTEGEMLVARVMLRDDPDRVSYRFVNLDGDGNGDEEEDAPESAAGPNGEKAAQPKVQKQQLIHQEKGEEDGTQTPQILFDGLLSEGDSLTLTILDHNPDGKKMKTFYTRRFEGKDGTRSW